MTAAVARWHGGDLTRRLGECLDAAGVCDGLGRGPSLGGLRRGGGNDDLGEQELDALGAGRGLREALVDIGVRDHDPIPEATENKLAPSRVDLDVIAQRLGGDAVLLQQGEELLRVEVRPRGELLDGARQPLLGDGEAQAVHLLELQPFLDELCAGLLDDVAAGVEEREHTGPLIELEPGDGLIVDDDGGREQVLRPGSHGSRGETERQGDKSEDGHRPSLGIDPHRRQDVGAIGARPPAEKPSSEIASPKLVEGSWLSEDV